MQAISWGHNYSISNFLNVISWIWQKKLKKFAYFKNKKNVFIEIKIIVHVFKGFLKP